MPTDKRPKTIEIVGRGSSEVSTSVDELDQIGIADLRKAQIEYLRSTKELREGYARKTFAFLWAWSTGIFVVLILSGFSFFGFGLPKTALYILVGSTTVSAIGLVALVGQGLFRVPHNK